MTGYEELDEYGSWRDASRNTARSGTRRSVPVGWMPYRDGYWDAGSSRGAGTGSMPSPGASRRSITAAGPISTGCGAGSRATYVETPVYAPALVGWIGDPERDSGRRLRWAGGRLVPARPGRGVLPGLHRQPGLSPRHQRRRGDQCRAPSARGRPAAAQRRISPTAASPRWCRSRPSPAAPSPRAPRCRSPTRRCSGPRSSVRPTVPQPAQAATAAARVTRIPGTPNFSRLSGPAGRERADRSAGRAELRPLADPRPAVMAAAPAGVSTMPSRTGPGTAAERGAATAGAIRGARGARLAPPRVAGSARVAGPRPARALRHARLLGGGSRDAGISRPPAWPAGGNSPGLAPLGRISPVPRAWRDHGWRRRVSQPLAWPRRISPDLRVVGMAAADPVRAPADRMPAPAVPTVAVAVPVVAVAAVTAAAVGATAAASTSSSPSLAFETAEGACRRSLPGGVGRNKAPPSRVRKM